jgi:hypothetical protein
MGIAEENRLSPTIIALKWGIIGGIISFILTLFIKYSGLEEDFTESLGWVSFLATLLINTSVLYLTLKEVRDHQDDVLSYGQGLGNSTLLGAIWGVASGGFNYIYLNFIDQGVIQKQMDLAREKLESQGLSESQIEEAEKITKLMMGPGIQFLMIVVVTILFMFLLGLVVSAIVKREKSIFDE